MNCYLTGEPCECVEGTTECPNDTFDYLEGTEGDDVKVTEEYDEEYRSIQQELMMDDYRWPELRG